MTKPLILIRADTYDLRKKPSEIPDRNPAVDGTVAKKIELRCCPGTSRDKP